MSDFIFTEDGLDDYIYWQTQDKKTLRKINALLKAIKRSPFTGEGKPEPMKGEKSTDFPLFTTYPLYVSIQCACIRFAEIKTKLHLRRLIFKQFH